MDDKIKIFTNHDKKSKEYEGLNYQKLELAETISNFLFYFLGILSIILFLLWLANQQQITILIMMMVTLQLMTTLAVLLLYKELLIIKHQD